MSNFTKLKLCHNIGISQSTHLWMTGIFTLLLLFIPGSKAKAQTYQTFDASKSYSRTLIDAKINDFAGNTKPMGFGSYNSETGTITQPVWYDAMDKKSSRKLVMDYVAGLVAKACIEAADYYKDFTWSKPWVKLIENYATSVSVPTTGESLDDLNASKMYFALAELTKPGAKYENTTTYNKAITELKNALLGLKAVNDDYSIRSGSTVNYYSSGKKNCKLVNASNEELSPATYDMNAIGGWYHKATYPNQMWCDSEYMGPALLAQLVAYATSNSSAGIGTITGTTEGDWKLVAKQFDITWNYLWNSTDKLLYHGFSATPTAIAAHTYTWATGTNGTNTAYWARAIGWYFLALVDVLENMPDNISDDSYKSSQNNLSTRDANIKTRLKSYLTDLASGIWAKKESGSDLWTNVINEAVGTEHSTYATTSDKIQSNTKNYLEASASAIYIAAYIKAMRLGLLNANAYKSGIEIAYKNYISNFITTNNTIINTCASAGLGGGNVDINSPSSDYASGGKKYRNGTADYYTRGYDVTKITDYQEGKPLGAFILASTEYERYMKADYAPSFTDANSENPTAQTITKGSSVTLHAAAMAKPVATYQWYSYPASASQSSKTMRAAATVTAIEGATSSDLTVSPTENTYYYCEATNSQGTAQTAPVLLSVSEESIGGESGNESPSSGEVTISLTNKNSTCTDDNNIVTVDVSKSQPSSSSDFCKVARGNSFTVSSDKTITKIVINYTESSYVPKTEGAVTVDNGSFEYNTTSTSSTWTGSATSVTFTDDSSTGNDLRITSIVVTYSDGSSSTEPTPSDLKIKSGSEYEKNKTWTPAVNGTIALSELVTSSSDGAFSISGDAGTLNGTTLTAVKSGTITLSQAATSTYAAGTVDITIRIGENVTSDGTNTYSFPATTAVSDGMTIARKDITMTFGADGFWSQASENGYTNGQKNPSVTGNVPTAGTYYKFTPTAAGTLAVKVRLGTTTTDGKYYLRPLYVSKNGTLITATLDDNTEVGTGTSPEYTGNRYDGNVTFNVEANTDYYVYVTSSKLGFSGFTFTPTSTGGETGGSTTGEVIYFKTGTTSSNENVLKVTQGSAKTGSSVSYKGETYSNGVKMESDTDISLILTAESTVTFVFDTPSKKFKVGNDTYTTGSDGTYTITLQPGTYSITKSDASVNLYAVDIQPTGPSMSVSTQPKSAEYVKSGTAKALSVGITFSNATESDYTLSYKWYSNTANSTTGGTEIGREAKYTPSTGTVGTTYYYCVVTATKKEGVGTLTATSDVATITVSEPYVEFTKQPTGGQYTKGTTAAALSVVAETNTGATISYQWYSNSTSSKEDATAITIDGTSNTYTPSTATTGTTYYYCVASVTSGSETITATSDIVSVEVVGELYSLKVDANSETPKCNDSWYIKGKSGENLVKMTFGGWKWGTNAEKNNNTYLRPNKEDVPGNYITDAWKKPVKQDKVNPLDGYEYAIAGLYDAVHEDKTAVTKMYNKPRYGWFVSPTRENGITTESFPFTLPVRGAYMTFEPTQNGTLTIYLLQNGAWNSDTENNIDIIPGEFRMHAFQITNQRGLVLEEFAPQYKITVNQKVMDGYTCSAYDEFYKPTTFNKDSKDIKDWEEFWDLNYYEREAVYDNWDNGTNDSQTIIKLKNGSFLAIQKAIVKYQFHVTGNETYYIFSNFSKLGFSGATFQPDDADAQPTESLSLSDTKKYTAPTAGTDAVVDNVTIPQYKEITLNRTFTADRWTTLTLPFNLTQEEVQKIFGAGTQIIMLNNATLINEGARLEFIYHEIQNVLPGYPYLIKPTLVPVDATNDANVKVNGDNSAITSFTVYGKCINPSISQFEVDTTPYTFKGTPDYCTADEYKTGSTTPYSVNYKENDIFVSERDGKLYVSGGTSYGKGYRAWLQNKAGTTAVKSISVVMSSFSDDDNTTTAIDVAEIAPDLLEALGIQTGVYNLSGQRVANDTHNLKAGIYIVNGKKTVVK